jgi:hypothetical protein
MLKRKTIAKLSIKREIIPSLNLRRLMTIISKRKKGRNIKKSCRSSIL